jgi:hypothetical protein
MTFKTTAIITALVSFLLGAGYLLVGELIMGRWQIPITESVLLVGRRSGALYLGLSVIFFLARSAPVSSARTALCSGTAIALLVLALLGIYELSSGHVGKGILASITIESLLAVAYVRLLLIERKQAAGS